MMDITEHVAIAPLFNFEIEDNFIHQSFSIMKPCSRDELEKKYQLNFKYVDELEVAYWIQSPIYVNRISPPTNSSDVDFSETQKVLNSFFNILMLFKPWSMVPLLIGPFQLVQYKNSKFSGSLRGGTVPTNFTSLSPQQMKVSLKISEFESFKKFFDKLYPIFQRYTNKEMENRIISANYWMSKTRENIKPYDRLIFLITALESLVSQHEDELTHKISQRCAILLGGTEPERLAIFQSIKEYYDLRSRVVHGTPKIEVAYYVSWYLQEIVRTLILKFISLHENGFNDSSKFLKKLDYSIFDSTLRDDILNKSNLLFNDKGKIFLKMEKS